MKAFISSIQPNPISVYNHHTVVLVVTATAVAAVPQARLTIINKQPKAAQLFDSNENADEVHSEAKFFAVGQNHIQHQIGFHLEGSSATFGAIIGIDICIQDGAGKTISPTQTILATIGA